MERLVSVRECKIDTSLCLTCIHAHRLPTLQNLYECLHPILLEMIYLEEDGVPLYAHRRDFIAMGLLTGEACMPDGFDINFNRVAMEMRSSKVDWIFEETNWPFSFNPFWINYCNNHNNSRIILPNGGTKNVCKRIY